MFADNQRNERWVLLSAELCEAAYGILRYFSFFIFSL